MKQSGKNVVIVGGGLPGLFSALLVSDRYPGYQVHLIERDAKLGGLYNSFRDGDAGWFDHGMHIIYESCVDEVDRHIRETMDEKDWIFLSGNHKDIAGVFYNGALQEESPYIDIRALEKSIRQECVADLMLSLSDRNLDARDCASAHDFFLRRFGPSITNNAIEPILGKLWKTGGANLDPMATRVVLMDRVRLFDSHLMADLMKSGLIRSRIAFPRQMELPLAYRSAQRGLYPRQFGMFRVIQAIEKKLLSRGVKIHTGADIEEIAATDGAVRTVRLKGADGAFTIDDIHLMHWSIPLFGLAPKLGVPFSFAKADPPRKQVNVYCLLKQAPRMGPLYYFYCFDPGYRTFRVTNYAGYCPDARRPDGAYPVCVELHFDAADKLEGLDLAALAAKELRDFGVIGSLADISYSKAEVSKTGFPLLTLNNGRILRELREQVEAKGIGNLVTAGQSPERGIFFLHDVLEHSYNAIVKFRNWQ